MVVECSIERGVMYGFDIFSGQTQGIAHKTGAQLSAA